MTIVASTYEIKEWETINNVTTSGEKNSFDNVKRRESIVYQDWNASRWNFMSINLLWTILYLGPCWVVFLWGFSRAVYSSDIYRRHVPQRNINCRTQAHSHNINRQKVLWITSTINFLSSLLARSTSTRSLTY